VDRKAYNHKLANATRGDKTVLAYGEPFSGTSTLARAWLADHADNYDATAYVDCEAPGQALTWTEVIDKLHAQIAGSLGAVRNRAQNGFESIFELSFGREVRLVIDNIDALFLGDQTLMDASWLPEQLPKNVPSL